MARLKTANGETIRPVAHLYSLEIHVDAGPEEKKDEPIEGNVVQDESNPIPQVGTRARTSAMAARAMWRNMVTTGQL